MVVVPFIVTLQNPPVEVAAMAPLVVPGVPDGGFASVTIEKSADAATADDIIAIAENF